MHAWVGWVLFGAVMAMSAPALAQSDSADARQLFEEGRALAKAGRYGEACSKFELSNQRNHGIGTSFNLADCWEHLGKLASAWAKFRDVADEAARANQLDREAVALQRAEALLPRLSYVIVRTSADDPRGNAGLEVRRNGVISVAADRDRPIALDAGEYQFEATAPGKQRWVSRVAVAEGQTVEVVIPVLRASESLAQSTATLSTAPMTRMAVAPGGAASPAPPDTAHRRRPAQRVAAYVVGAGGVVAVGIGAIFGARVLAKNDRANSICPSGHGCSPTDGTDYQLAISEAREARTNALVAFGIGGAALLTGVVLYVTAPNSSTTAVAASPTRRGVPRSTARWTPELGPRFVGAQWELHF
jgi:tetratricopeptide (TPR) repeat protein